MRKKRKAMAEKHQWKPLSSDKLRAFIDKVKAVPLSEQQFILPKANNVPEKTASENRAECSETEHSGEKRENEP